MVSQYLAVENIHFRKINYKAELEAFVFELGVCPQWNSCVTITICVLPYLITAGGCRYQRVMLQQSRTITVKEVVL